MTMRRTFILTTILAVLACATPAPADVVVWFEPAEPTVVLGETVAVDIMANFETAVIGWGIDLAVGESGYADWIGTTIGADWDATDTLDGDGLAGLRYPDGLAGDVLLATLTFEGLAEGVTTLTLSSGPEEDEGFLLDTGVLASNVQFTPTTLTVIPEPATALLAVSLLAFRRR